MCLSIDETGRRPRVLLSIGMLCLAISLGSQAFSLSFGLAPAPLHFLRGFLLGISVSLTLIARRRSSLEP
jgi:hypothetical protein